MRTDHCFTNTRKSFGFGFGFDLVPITSHRLSLAAHDRLRRLTSGH